MGEYKVGKYSGENIISKEDLEDKSIVGNRLLNKALKDPGKFRTDSMIKIYIREIIRLKRLLAESLTKLRKYSDSDAINPRARALMNKGQKFIVVADDEEYFMEVYEMIREDQIAKGHWDIFDQESYHEANIRFLVNLVRIKDEADEIRANSVRNGKNPSRSN